VLAVPACGARTPLYEEVAVVPVASSAPSPVPAVDAGPAPDVRPPNPFTPGSEWKGTYFCPQGETDLVLRIVRVHGDTIDDAVFDFDWSGGVSGSFHLRGTYDEPTAHAVFEPGAWISHPSGWYSVGMDGTVANEVTYAGTIVADGCGSFRVTRSP
jgi:hypothetical protein